MAVTAAGSGTWTDPIGASVTMDITTDKVTKTSHGFVAGDKIVFAGTLPTGLTAGTEYFVVSPTTNDFQVSATEGGSAIDMTVSNGSGITITSVEHILASINTAGSYTMHVSTVNLAAGDIVEFAIYQMVLTGGAREGAYWASYSGAQPAKDRVKISVPISNELTDTGALRFTIKQTRGTARAFPWKVLKYA